MYYNKMDHTQELWGMRRRSSGGLRSPSRFMYLCAFVLIMGVVLTLLNIYQLHKMKEEHDVHQAMTPFVEAQAQTDTGKSGPVAWINGDNMHTGYLQNVIEVFQQCGFSMGGVSDWDVLWNHKYPFVEMKEAMSKLKPHQKVNHFPGSGFITNKVSLAVTKLHFIPRAFKLPSEKEKFLAFSKANPHMMWVQKNNNHRGIQIKTAAMLDLSKEGSFIQQYVDKPFLIDGHKFDIGIYAILTSIDPLRVYIVEDDALFRFCPEQYYPFDPSVKDKYVVHDDYMPLWKVPSLQDLYSVKGFNFKVTFNQYMKSKGLAYEKVWADMISAIRAVYKAKEYKLMESTGKYAKGQDNFFEMARFDFVLDKDLKVYLMEANMSPNLSSKHFPPNRRLYQHVIFSLLQLVGLTQHLTPDVPHTQQDMRVAPTDVRVFPEQCSSNVCSSSCSPMQCKLCRKCVDHRLEHTLKAAFLEHQRRGATRRILPSAINATVALRWDPTTDWPGTEELSEMNALMARWFVGMCRQDPTFCV